MYKFGVFLYDAATRDREPYFRNGRWVCDECTRRAVELDEQRFAIRSAPAAAAMASVLGVRQQPGKEVD